MPTLFARADAARLVLETAACVRALKKAEKRERTGSQNYKPDAGQLRANAAVAEKETDCRVCIDAIWPLVGYCTWYCSTFLDSIARHFAQPLSSDAAEQADPTLALILHPRTRMFISTGARALLALDAWLGSPESGVEGSEAIDLARTILHDAVTNAFGGAGLAAWVSALEKVTSEMDGGEQSAMSNVLTARTKPRSRTCRSCDGRDHACAVLVSHDPGFASGTGDNRSEPRQGRVAVRVQREADRAAIASRNADSD